jgi:hypothetical protein
VKRETGNGKWEMGKGEGKKGIRGIRGIRGKR